MYDNRLNKIVCQICIKILFFTAERMLEELPKAKALEPRTLTDTERKRIKQQEESTLRELRLFLRDVINKLGRDRKFAIFSKPVDIDEVSFEVNNFLKLRMII